MNNVQILVAEDEPHIAKLVAFKLGKEGYEVQVAKNGQEALDLLPTRPWALVILDVMMPLKDGWEVLKAIRADQKHAKLPVLMLTAKGNSQVEANAAELGATAVLRKPFDPNELAATVKRMLLA